MKHFIGIYNRSVLLTYLGVGCAVAGMALAFGGNIRHAMPCLVIAGICDLLDGFVARLCKRTDEEKAFGVQIDSLADVVDFAVFPVVLALGMGFRGPYHIVVYILFVLAAITRLGFFNIGAVIGGGEPRAPYFRGLPVTYAALILPTVWLCRLWLPEILFPAVYTAAMLMIAFLFVADIKISKPRGKSYLFFVLLAAGLIAGILLLGS